MEMGAIVTVMIFMAGVIFAFGRLTARVEHLEAYRGERRDDVRNIIERLDRLERIILGQSPE